MLRQASSRNQRSKGFKIKHALQICLLIAICIWLLYQVKHSHEKKRAFEERNSKMRRVDDSQADFFKFGRKDLPQIEETVSVNETHNKEEENEETQEEEEEQDTKQEEIDEEEGTTAGDDEIDEQDQDKGDEEAEHGEESTEEDDKDGHDEGKDIHDEVDVFDNQEHQGGTQEAREENYKRDDASSAVVHDPHATESETSTGGAVNTDEEHVIDKADVDSHINGSTGVDGIGSKGEVVGENLGRNIVESDSSANGSTGVNDTNSDGSKGEVVGENLQRKIVESENVTNISGDGSKGDNGSSAGSGGASVGDVSDTIQNDNLSSNATAADIKDVEVDNKDVEIEFSKADNESVSNSTTVESNSQMEQQTNVMLADESNTQLELQINSTGGVTDFLPEVQNNHTLVSNGTASLDFAQNQNVAADNATVREYALTSQNVVEQAENSDTNVVLDSEEHPTVSTSEGESEDSSHAALTEEEKDARTDLSTLPDIQNEVKTADDEAAE